MQTPDEVISAVARIMGRKGGKARAASLTPERRAEIAKKANRARNRKRRKAKADSSPATKNLTTGTAKTS